MPTPYGASAAWSVSAGFAYVVSATAIAEVEQVLNGRLVPAEIAPQFEIEAGENMSQVPRTYRLTTGKIAEIAFNLYPIDRFRFAITLRRVESRGSK